MKARATIVILCSIGFLFGAMLPPDPWALIGKIIRDFFGG